MRVIWITNIPPSNEIAEAFEMKMFAGGGWLKTVFRQLLDMNIELAVVFPCNKQDVCIHKTINGVKCCQIPDIDKMKTSRTSAVQYEMEKLIQNFNPDIVHIWGTEHVHSYMIMRICNKLKMDNRTVVSIQGLVSVCERHFECYMEPNDFNKATLRDYIRRDSMKRQRENMRERGEYEKKVLSMAKHVIGRTDWDRACTSILAPAADYHFCNETLRESFYEGAWELEKAKMHSIFVSQSQMPIKGIHLAIQAMKILKKKYPDIHLYATGKDRINISFTDKLKETGYDRYIRKIIEENGLENNITFLGGLGEEKMKEQFLSANVFVLSSSIENSPNSLGEAMLLGTPCVASDVGGVSTMLVHKKEGYIYPADEPYQLAYWIDQVFENTEQTKRMARQAQMHARKTHDKEINLKQLVNIYRMISENGGISKCD